MGIYLGMVYSRLLFVTSLVVTSAANKVSVGWLLLLKVSQDYCSYFVVIAVVLRPCSAPGNLSGVVVNSTSVLVSWTPLPVSEQNGALTNYRLTYSGVELDREEVIHILSSTALTYNVTGLEEGTEYRVSLAALTSAGAGPETSITVSTSESCKHIMIRY